MGIAHKEEHPEVMLDCRERAGLDGEHRRLIDAIPGLIWTARPDGSIDFLNGRWCAYTGIRAEDGYGRRWQGVIHPDDLPELLERRSSF